MGLEFVVKRFDTISKEDHPYNINKAGFPNLEDGSRLPCFVNMEYLKFICEESGGVLVKERDDEPAPDPDTPPEDIGTWSHFQVGNVTVYNRTRGENGYVISALYPIIDVPTTNIIDRLEAYFGSEPHSEIQTPNITVDNVAVPPEHFNFSGRPNLTSYVRRIANALINL